MKIVLTGCGLEMSDERYEIVDVTNDNGEGISVCDTAIMIYFKINESLDKVERIVDTLNHLEDTRKRYRRERDNARTENEKLWSVVDGFKSLLELEFEGKI